MQRVVLGECRDDDMAARAIVVVAGFVDFEITARVDVYAGAPQSSSAVQLDTMGIAFGHASR